MSVLLFFSRNYQQVSIWGQFYPSKEFLDICGSIFGCQMTGENSKPRGKVVHFLLYVGQSCKIIKTASLHMPRLAAFRGTGCNLKGSSQDS